MGVRPQRAVLLAMLLASVAMGLPAHAQDRPDQEPGAPALREGLEPGEPATATNDPYRPLEDDAATGRARTQPNFGRRRPLPDKQ